MTSGLDQLLATLREHTGGNFDYLHPVAWGAARRIITAPELDDSTARAQLRALVDAFDIVRTEIGPEADR